MSRVKSPPAWLVEGAMVDYHSVIGGPITQFNMRARTAPQKMGDHWSIWLDGKASSVSVDACTPATGSLGPSNDDSPAVQVEMRAAGLDAWYAVDDLSVSQADGWSDFEVDGWRAHCSESDLVGSPDMVQAIRPDFDAGWLACETTMHDVREHRDATAWAWDISRPLAEQLAETAADDAAADALEPTDVIAQDPTDDTGDM